jgi:hypothetical protein
MENSEPMNSSQAERPRWIRYLVLVALLLVLVIVFFAYPAWSTNGTPSEGQLLSQADLEEEYGLQVRLIGVTGGGGLIDFRLKMTDAEKARQFLQDPDNLPVLLVTAEGTQMLAADSMDDDITWEDDEILFILLPNSVGEIQPGSPISIKFGELQLEPIPAQ